MMGTNWPPAKSMRSWGARALLLLRWRRVLLPPIGKYNRRPAIPTPLLAQAPQGRKCRRMRTRDQDIPARELRQQLIPRRRSRRLVDVENRGDLRMLQLDALGMDDIAPKQDFLSLRRKLIAG